MHYPGKRSVAFALVSAFLLSACASVGPGAVKFRQTEERILYKFAYANCLFQYFKKKATTFMTYGL